jgi:hypothetical protein
MAEDNGNSELVQEVQQTQQAADGGNASNASDAARQLRQLCVDPDTPQSPDPATAEPEKLLNLFLATVPVEDVARGGLEEAEDLERALAEGEQRVMFRKCYDDTMRTRIFKPFQKQSNSIKQFLIAAPSQQKQIAKLERAAAASSVVPHLAMPQQMKSMLTAAGPEHVEASRGLQSGGKS